MVATAKKNIEIYNYFLKITFSNHTFKKKKYLNRLKRSVREVGDRNLKTSICKPVSVRFL
jgi:hypothetical protein